MKHREDPKKQIDLKKVPCICFHYDEEAPV